MMIAQPLHAALNGGSARDYQEFLRAVGYPAAAGHAQAGPYIYAAPRLARTPA
jgi:hypothetical protein